MSTQVNTFPWTFRQKQTDRQADRHTLSLFLVFLSASASAAQSVNDYDKDRHSTHLYTHVETDMYLLAPKAPAESLPA